LFEEISDEWIIAAFAPSTSPAMARSISLISSNNYTISPF